MFRKVFEFNDLFGSEFYNLSLIKELPELYISYIPDELKYENFIDINKIKSELKKYSIETLNEYLYSKTEEYIANEIREHCWQCIVFSSCTGIIDDNDLKTTVEPIVLFSDGIHYIDFNSENVFELNKGKFNKVDVDIDSINDYDIDKVAFFYNKKFLKELINYSYVDNMRKLSLKEYDELLDEQLLSETGFETVDNILYSFDEQFGFDTEDFKGYLDEVIKNIKKDIKEWLKNECNN